MIRKSKTTSRTIVSDTFSSSVAKTGLVLWAIVVRTEKANTIFSIKKTIYSTSNIDCFVLSCKLVVLLVVDFNY
jgi:hypothetical protein